MSLVFFGVVGCFRVRVNPKTNLWRSSGERRCAVSRPTKEFGLGSFAEARFTVAEKVFTQLSARMTIERT